MGMGLDLPSGGHLTHGYYTSKKKISASSIYFETLPYKVHPETGLIDFEELRKSAIIYRPGMIFYKYTHKIPDIKDRIDQAVFPALQGGPHNHQIGALAAQLKEVNSPEFKEYSKQVVENTQTLAGALMEKGHKLATDGTDNHLILWDLRPHGLTGSKLEKITDTVSITLNRNAVHGDASALSPGGVRVGMPAMTTRGCKVEESRQIAAFLDQCVQIAIRLQQKTGKKLKDFELAIPQDD